MNQSVIPFFLWRRPLPTPVDPDYSFTAGLGDVVLFYDPMEMAAYRHCVPSVKSTALVKHPCRTPLEIEPSSGQKRKLLAMLSSYSTELPPSKIDFWVRAIRGAVDAARIDQTHLRFHPRTAASLRWPQELRRRLTEARVSFVDAPPSNAALVETIHDYVGAIGAYSGSLRTARAAAENIFVVGLLDAGEPSPFEAPWVLGDSEGIVWIGENDKISADLFSVPTPRDTDRPTAAQFLKEWATPVAVS